MLSIIVTGRNDAYGYNAHKRTAIGLNCFADQLVDPADEIVFVDYNTPDSLPTLPEAIADTLTEQARSRLRVLRVRPAVHHRVALIEEGTLLDVIAHNVGYRRTNPENRWILSTTTDVVLLPGDTVARAGELIAELPDGFYSLPRYEVPQLVWEAFDRHKPEEIKEQLRAMASRLHLREAVSIDPPVVIDACGDFQLMLREDIFELNGMDERMTFGWQHSDANLQVRMALWRGIDFGLSEHLEAYHCSHQRAVSITQRRQRLEHDWETFVADVKTARLSFQADSWGLAGEEIEEIRLVTHSPPRGVAELISVIGRERHLVTKVARSSATYDSVTIPIAHVLPFIADQLASLASKARLAYIGANTRLAADLANLAARKGHPPLLITAACLDAVSAAPLDAPHQRAVSLAGEDIRAVIVDFSLADDDLHGGPPVHVSKLTDQQRTTLETVRKEWSLFVESRKDRSDNLWPTPLVIAVNAIHTSAEGLLDADLEGGHAPFTTRVRSGVLKSGSTGLPTRAELDAHMTTLLGRGISPAELSLGLTALVLLRSGTTVSELPSRLVTMALAAILDFAPLMDRVGLRPAVLGDLRTRIVGITEKARSLAEAVSAPPFGRCGPGLSTLADPADWDHPEWSKWAALLGDHDGRRDPLFRDRANWERIQFAYALDRLHGLRGTAIAAVAVQPENLCGLLASVVDYVDLIPLSPLTEAEAGEWHRRSRGFAPADRVRIVKAGFREFDGPTCLYSTVLFLGGTACRDGVVGFAERLDFARRLLARGGFLGFTADVCLSGSAPHGMISLDWLRSPVFDKAMEVAGFTPCSVFSTVSVKFGLGRWLQPMPDAKSFPHILVLDGENAWTSGAVFFRLAKDEPVDLDRLRSELLRLANPIVSALTGSLAYTPVNVLPSLRLGRGAERGDGGVRIAAGSGHGLFGPYLSLPEGEYQLDWSGTGTAAAFAREIAEADVYAGGSDPQVIARMHIRSKSRRWRESLRFKVPPGDNRSYEFRLFVGGASEVTVTGVGLRRLNSDTGRVNRR